MNRDQQQTSEPEPDEPADDSPTDGAAEPDPDDERRADEATVADRLNRVARYAAGGASSQDRSGGKDSSNARSSKDISLPATSGSDPHETLTVGRRIRLIAKLCECAELLVQGYLEATARTKILRVAEGGCFIGTAEVEFADIRGHFEGNLTATKKLVIHPSGIVSGTARYQEIIIEAGGQITGSSQSLASQAAAANAKANGPRKPKA